MDKQQIDAIRAEFPLGGMLAVYNPIRANEVVNELLDYIVELQDDKVTYSGAMAHFSTQCLELSREKSQLKAALEAETNRANIAEDCLKKHMEANHGCINCYDYTGWCESPNMQEKCGRALAFNRDLWKIRAEKAESKNEEIPSQIRVLELELKQARQSRDEWKKKAKAAVKAADIIDKGLRLQELQGEIERLQTQLQYADEATLVRLLKTNVEKCECCVYHENKGRNCTIEEQFSTDVCKDWQFDFKRYKVGDAKCQRD